MILRFTLFLLLNFVILSFSVAQLPEDCVDAVNLVNTSIPLSEVDTITIDSLISIGNDPSELELIEMTTCGPTGYIPTENDKSYWFGFSATNSGTLEFMIFPENLNTDYDFALWKGSCPFNPCSEPIFCSWVPSLCGAGVAFEYTPTGVAQDPLATFGVDQNLYLSLEIYQETLQLEAGENYFLLIENRNELLQCGVEDSLGFTILFDGTATVGPLLPDPIARVNFPLETDLKRCKNTSVEFSVTDIPDAEYQWTLPDNSILNGDNSRFINLGTISGQLCVEILCPIQDQFCWDIEVGDSPLLVATNPTPPPCTTLELEEYVEDANNVSGRYALFQSEIDALSLTNELPQDKINENGTYWIRKITDLCNSDPIEVVSNLVLPNLDAPSRQGTCDLPYVLDNITITETNGIQNLNLLYYASEADAINNNNPITEATNFGRIWVSGVIDSDCQDTISIEIFDANPTFQPITPIQVCDEVDISSFRPVLMDNTPVDFDNFFESRAAAEDGSLPLSSTIITESQIVWGRAEIAAGCVGVAPIDVTINKTTIEPIDPISFCNGSYDLNDLPLIGADTYKYYGSEENAENDFFDFDGSVNTSSTIWVRGESSTNGCSDIISVEFISADPNIAPLQNAIPGCGNSFDLNSISLSEVNGIGLTYSFHTSLGDAETGANVIASGIVNNSNTYYVRGVAPGAEACYDVEEITINIVVPNVQPPPAQRLDNGEFDLRTVNILDLVRLENLTNLTFFEDSLSAVDGTNELSSPIVMDVSTYWIRGELNGCPVIVPQEILAESMATIPLPDLPVISLPCDGGCVNLAEEISVQDLAVNNSTSEIYFFESIDEADDGLLEDTLTDLIFCDPTLVYIRGVASNGEFGTTSVQVGGREIISGELTTSDQAICAENANQISLEFQLEGTPPFQLTYSDGRRDFIEVSNTNNFSLAVNPDSTTTYTLVNVNDAKGCPGMAMGAVTITILEEVTIGDFEEICNDLQTSYTISFDIQTGDLASLMVDGISATRTGNRYISNPIPVEDGYFFSISDINGCKDFEKNGTVICQCFTEAATLDRTPLNVCIDKTLRANKLAIGEPSMTDREFYVLHDSNTDQLGEIFTAQENTDFSYNDLANQGINLEVGTTYYLSSVFTRLDDQGEPILDPAQNPCIGVSRGIPVKFFEVPEVTITLDKDTACADDQVNLLFEMNAENAYNVNVVGSEFLELENIPNGHTQSIPVSATDFVVEYIEIVGVEGCIDDSRSDSTTLEIFESINYEEDIIMTCDDEGRAFTITFTITGGDPTSYAVEGSIDGTIEGNIFTSRPILHESNYRFEITDRNNCEPVVIQDFGECLCTSDITTTISQIQEITCPGDEDAAVEVTAQNGLRPYTFQWQDGSTSERLLNLGKGMVYVSMTDANECVRTDSFFVEGPDPIVPEITMNPPNCFGDENGSIIIRKVNGGTKPFEFSFNGTMLSTSQLYGNLTAQDYPLRIIDVNGCDYRDTLILEDPDPLTVSLLNNPKKLNLGDSIEIDTRVSEDGVAFIWTSNSTLSCTDCLNPITKPTETGIYSIKVTNEFGCSASDELVIQVLNDKSFYAPTVFSPNGDGINDTFGIFGGSQVSNINSLKIFNRWGAMLYNRTNLGQQVPFEEGWDGMETNGDRAPSGIYVFVAEIVYSDGSVEVVTGDVALMR